MKSRIGKRRPKVKSRKRVARKTTRVTVDYPTSIHRRLKAKAALEGVSLQQYIRSRTMLEEEVSDDELKPIVEKIIEENEEILKRLSKK